MIGAMPAPLPASDDIAAKLDAMLHHLERMDRRDRLRTWGGFARGLFGLIPLAFFVVSAWYVTTHGDEIIRKVSEESAKAASKYAQEQSASFMEQFQNLIPKK